MIDFHTHMFPDKIAKSTIAFLAGKCKTKPYTDGTLEGLLHSTKEAGIDISIALPVVTKPSQYRSVNTFAADHMNGQIIPFAGIHPEDSDYKEKLSSLKSMGFKGIKLHPDYQEMYFNDIRYKRIIAWATELGLIVSVHAGVDPKCPDDVHCTPKMAEEVLNEVRPEKLVLAHMGGNEMWDDVEHYLVGRNVYFDTAVVLGKISDEQLIRIIGSHGADKILFATDSPWAGQKEFVYYLKNLPITEEQKKLIFHENAAKLLGIEN